MDANSARWLLLLYGLPSRRNAERVSLWRKLKKFGAVQLKSSAYVLPDAPEHYERFQWLARQLQDAGGEANLIRVAEIDGVGNGELVGMFNDARAAEYKELAAACQAALARNKQATKDERLAELAKYQRRFQEIREIDYFDSPDVHEAQVALQRAEKALAPGKHAPPARILQPGQFAGKTWLTRPRPGIDRAGSAWLIRKFIDAQGRFVFGMKPAAHPQAIPFDMSDVEFSHHGDDCTFETLVKRFGITDRAVLKMAEMVHDADLEDDKFHRGECIGLNCVLTGWAKTGMSDDELLAKGIECFDGLYQTLRK